MRSFTPLSPFANPRSTVQWLTKLPFACLLLLISVKGLPARTSARAIKQPTPAVFVANQGQNPQDVRFESLGLGGRLLFTERQILMDLPSANGKDTLTVSYNGPAVGTALEALDPLPGKFNYFFGADQSTWHTNLPTYSGIRYRQLYSGIDMIYEGEGGNLKGTFRVSPRTDPSAIRWHYEGAENVEVDSLTGDLQVSLPSGNTLIEHAPVAWQVVQGKRVDVPAQFTLDAEEVGFTLGRYDSSLELIIDPVLEYSTYIATNVDEEAFDIAVDDQGFAYVIGRTDSPNFPDDFQMDEPPLLLTYIVKINPREVGPASLVWSTILGGPGWGRDIAVDNEHNVYAVGEIYSNTLPVTANAFQHSMGNTSSIHYIDAFLTKFDPSGSQLLYSTYIGGNDGDAAYSVAVDNQQNAYVYGSTGSSDFPVTASAYSSANALGSARAFLTKIDTRQSGTASLIYSTYFGNGEPVGGIAVDNAGNAFFAGQVGNPRNFPVTPNAYRTQATQFQAYSNDGFVAQIDTTKSGAVSLVYSSFFGAGNENSTYLSGDIATDGQGLVYLTGDTASVNFPVVNGFQSHLGGDLGATDGYVVVIDTRIPGEVGLRYSTYLGGWQSDMGSSIALTRDGNVYVTGVTSSDDFPLRNSIVTMPMDTNYRVFVSKIDTTQVGDASLIYSTLVGYGEQGGAAVDKEGAAYITATLLEGDFPIVNGFQTTKKVFDLRYRDAYMAKLAYQADLEVTKTVEPAMAVIGEPVTITLNVRGKGPDIATAARLSEYFPENQFVLNSVSSTQGSCHIENNVVLCNLGTIVPDQMEQVVILATPLFSDPPPPENPTEEPTATLVPEETMIAPQEVPLFTRAFSQSSPHNEVIAQVDGVEADTNPANNTAAKAIHVYTFDTFIPTLLTPLNNAESSSTTPKFAWKPVYSANGYEIQLARGDVEAAAPIRVATTQYQPSVPLLTTGYNWRVRAVKADGTHTLWSPVQHVTILAGRNAAPALNLMPNPTPTLTWSTISWASQYEIEIARDTSFKSLVDHQFLNAYTLEYTPTEPLANGTYFWHVRALQAGVRWGSWSAAQSFIISFP